MRRRSATYRRRSGPIGALQRTLVKLRIRRLLRRKVTAGAPVPGQRPRGDGLDGGAGVREPRRPLPTAGSGAVAVPVDTDA